MKKIALIFALFCVALSSCTKDNKSTLPTTYRIDQITDLQINYTSGSYSYLQLSVNYVGPIQENVSLSLSGLPAGITYDTTTTHSGIPTFATNFYITNDGSAIDGNYPITLVCMGSQTGKKSYTFNLKVLPKPSCSATVTGNWRNNTDCNGNVYIDALTASSSVKNRIVLSNFSGLGISVYADLDCSASAITIPSQQVGGHWYSGSGYFNSSNMGYYYQDSTAGVTTSCFDNMSR